MDDKWFKAQQKKVGVTADEIAKAIGRDRSLVSRIYVGRQKMKFEEAKIFAEILQVPLDEVLKHAGLVDTEAEKTQRAGLPLFSELIRNQAGDCEPYKKTGAELENAKQVARLLGMREGIDIWKVNTQAMIHSGILPGDTILVDTNQSERTKSGDIVLAEVYQSRRNTPAAILRRVEHPVLVADGSYDYDKRVHVLDGHSVVIRGKVIAQWRS
jgi:SOS-response transcriptional repressor LexA